MQAVTAVIQARRPHGNAVLFTTLISILLVPPHFIIQQFQSVTKRGLAVLPRVEWQCIAFLRHHPYTTLL
jgi:hypothetical protein